MKILICSYRFFPVIGGIELISRILAEDFTYAGHQVIVVTHTRADDLGFDQRQVYRISRNPGLNDLYKLYIWADAILQTNIALSLLFPWCLIRKPLILGMQTWLSGHTFFLKIMCLRLADRVITCSDALGREYNIRSITIRNPYDSNTFKLIPSQNRCNTIAFVGRLVRGKGADLLVNAFASLKTTWNLKIIGDGPQFREIDDLINRLHVRSNVTLCGELHGESLAKLLNQSEIMVVPSEWKEPFGIVALEGMACGCALLVANIGGLPEAVGDAGLLFTAGCKRDLSSKLYNLIVDHALRSKLKARSVKHLLRFTRHTVSARYLTEIEALRVCRKTG